MSPTPAEFDGHEPRTLPQCTRSFASENIFLLRSIPNCIASKAVRYHAARQLAAYPVGRQRAQVEGAALWGLSLAMYEKATLKDGGIEQTNFDTYTPLRMSQMPEVAVNVIANGDKPTGVGEPAVTVVAPAIGNAIFNACGARVRALPITAAAVKAAMKA